MDKEARRELIVARRQERIRTRGYNPATAPLNGGPVEKSVLPKGKRLVIALDTKLLKQLYNENND